MEGIQSPTHLNMEKIERAQLINQYWNESEFKIKVGENLLTLKECYDRQIAYSDEVFERTKKITSEMIPEGKYILFINSAKGGTADHPDIGLVDTERLEKMYRMETGSTQIDPEHFQENNMRRCLGFEKGDSRFRVINAYEDEIPKELHSNVGVVFSGSIANVFDEKEPENISMREKVRDFMLHTHEQNIDVPKLGICFGGQLSAEVYADATIGYVKNKEGQKSRVQGINKIFKTEIGEKFDFWEGLPEIKTAEDHGEQIEKESLKAIHAEILAVNEHGEVEVIYIKKAEAICTQFHPEAGSIRMDISESLHGRNTAPSELFEENTDKIREVLFVAFVKTIGRYIQAENNRIVSINLHS